MFTNEYLKGFSSEKLKAKSVLDFFQFANNKVKVI